MAKYDSTPLRFPDIGSIRARAQLNKVNLANLAEKTRTQKNANGARDLGIVASVGQKFLQLKDKAPEPTLRMMYQPKELGMDTASLNNLSTPGNPQNTGAMSPYGSDKEQQWPLFKRYLEDQGVEIPPHWTDDYSPEYDTDIKNAITAHAATQTATKDYVNQIKVGADGYYYRISPNGDLAEIVKDAQGKPVRVPGTVKEIDTGNGMTYMDTTTGKTYGSMQELNDARGNNTTQTSNGTQTSSGTQTSNGTQTGNGTTTGKSVPIDEKKNPTKYYEAKHKKKYVSLDNPFPQDGLSDKEFDRRMKIYNAKTVENDKRRSRNTALEVSRFQTKSNISSAQNVLSRINKVINSRILDKVTGTKSWITQAKQKLRINGKDTDLMITITEIADMMTLKNLIDSKKAGATYGALSDAEMGMLSNALGAIKDKNLSVNKLRENLKLIKKYSKKIEKYSRENFKALYGEPLNYRYGSEYTTKAQKAQKARKIANEKTQENNNEETTENADADDDSW